MCGVAGCFRLDGAAPEPDDHISMKRALEAMRLRGPDGSGIHEGGTWLLGHTRLAILDPASGAQPWIHTQTGCTLSYNGEIFNFREIRESLKAKGHEFRTSCDTEVLMAAYLEWGETCLARFNGFFAFLLADPRTNTLFAARDRLGVKPLHFMLRQETKCFAMASSIPALLACSGAKKAMPDIEAVSNYLSTARTSFGEKTLVEGVRSLPPGHFIRMNLKDASMQSLRYWSRPAMTSKEREESAPTFESATLSARELIDDATSMRLVSDVPLGAFLSGGLDSSIITLCAAKRKEAANLPLFCAGSSAESLNEYHFARRMADSLGLGLECVEVASSDFMRNWEALIKLKGLPLSTPNEISIFLLATKLAESCKVTLTGEGADEIFGGYLAPQFASYDMERCPKEPDASFMDSPLGISLSFLYGRSHFLNDTDHYLATSSWLPYSSKADLFSADAWAELEEDSPIFVFYEDFFDRHSLCSAFDRRMHLFAEFNLESLLFRVDSSTMAASVEARTPFTDYRLAEMAFSMPDSYKIDWLDPNSRETGGSLSVDEIARRGLVCGKRLPREAFKPLLPTEIVERKKMSFPVPFSEWIASASPESIKELCMDSPISKSLFRQSAIEAMLARPDRNIWLLANLCKWSSAMPELSSS